MRQPTFSKYLPLIIILIVFTSWKVEYQAVRDVHKTFSVSEGVTVKVNNKHGDIDVRVWNKNEVSFDIAIIANSSDEDAAEKFVEDTEIRFKQNGNLVSAETDAAKMKENKYWWNKWKNKNQSFEINYTISIPENSKVDFTNKYGDIILPDYDGDVEIELSYGNIEAGELKGNVDLQMKYSDASIDATGNANFNLSYSDIKVNSCDNVDILSIYSEITIVTAADIKSKTKYGEYRLGDIGNLTNDGGYDEFSIKKARKIDIDAKYTDVSVDALEVGFDLKTHYGEIEIENISSAFSGGAIDSKYTDIDLGFLGDYSIDMTGQYTDIDLPSNLTTSQMTKDGKEKRVKGYVGSSSAALLRATMNYGSLEIDD